MTTTESSLRAEVTQLLQELIRLDTVNPPGNETRAAELLLHANPFALTGCALLASLGKLQIPGNQLRGHL